MPTFTKLEDIKVWQKARAVTKLIYGLTAKESFARDLGLRGQYSAPACPSWRTSRKASVDIPIKSLPTI